MKALIFGAGLAVGYVLGARAGRNSYEHVKSMAQDFWQDPRLQEKFHEATDAVKEKAPEVQSQVAEALKEAAKKTSDTVAAALHHESAGKHGDAPPAKDIRSDPALDDTVGTDWTDEGGATPAGPATGTTPNSSDQDGSGPKR